VAQELGINPIAVKTGSVDIAEADMLVVGSGTYAGKPGREMVNFLENLSSLTGKKAACFSTSASGSDKTVNAMREILARKGYSVVDCFSCLGQWGWFVKRGHPTADELNQARGWAKKLA
jgi:flavorubredoxin